MKDIDFNDYEEINEKLLIKNIFCDKDKVNYNKYILVSIFYCSRR